MSLIVYIVLCYGFCNIIIYGSIFGWFRKLLTYLGEGDYSLSKLFSCFMCLGFWTGVAFYVSSDYFNFSELKPFTTNTYPIVEYFLAGLFTSGSTWLTHTLQEKLER